MKNLMRCECCGEKKLVEKYEVTSFHVNRNVKFNDVLCDDCAKRFGDNVRKISPTYPCDGCGEEISFYKLNKVPVLVHHNDYDFQGFCDECINRVEDQEERIMSGRDL